MYQKKCLVMVYLFGLVVSTSASMLVTEPPTTHRVSFMATPATVSYHEDTYMGTTANGTALKDDVNNIFLALDIESRQTISAEIDSNGDLQSGTITWTGNSEELGIARGSSLLTATITSVQFQPALTSFLFRARIDTVNPVLTDVIGPMKTLIARDFIIPFAWNGVAPWSVPFLETSFTSSPDIFLSPHVLPAFSYELPAQIRMLETSGPSLSAYDLATNTYTLDADFGDGAGSLSVTMVGSPGQLIQDLDADIQVSAIVLNNNDVESGSFSIVGSAPSIGAGTNTLLMSGSVLEANFSFAADEPSGIQTLLEVSNIYPGLAAVVGDLKTIILQDYEAPFGWGAAPWQSSYSSSSPFTFSPEVFATSVEYAISDLDGDGVANTSDNCFLITNSNQRDVDLDGIGSLCDTDFNNDCVVNFLDFAQIRDNFFGSDENIDVNADGVINFLDLSVFVDQFLVNFNTDNPSKAPNICGSN